MIKNNIKKMFLNNQTKAQDSHSQKTVTVSTTSLRSFIAMNKQYLTDRQYALLISPFDNDYLGCNGVVKAVACGYPQK